MMKLTPENMSRRQRAVVIGKTISFNEAGRLYLRASKTARIKTFLEVVDLMVRGKVEFDLSRLAELRDDVEWERRWRLC